MAYFLGAGILIGIGGLVLPLGGFILGLGPVLVPLPTGFVRLADDRGAKSLGSLRAGILTLLCYDSL
jgi:hypothetical protein